MTKLTLSDLANLQNENTAVGAINSNNTLIETAIDNTLSRDGSTPNQMGAQLDMNSNRIINLPAPSSVTEPLRLQDLISFVGGSIVTPSPSNNLPIVDGTAAAGIDTGYARSDHVHPTDTSRAAKTYVDSQDTTLQNNINTVQTNVNTLSTNTTNSLALKAPLASPALTGTPTAPTAAAGTNTAQLATTAFANAAADAAVDRKNYIVNGAMMVSQENGITAGTVTGYYPVDQFFLSFSNGGTFSTAQVVSNTPGGSPNRLQVTVTSADATVAAGDLLYIGQAIEGLRIADLLFGTASARTVTLRFGVKAPAGTYCVVLLNSAANRSYVAEYVISGGEANTDVVKTVTIPGDTSGTWLATNGIGITVRWGLMAGSTFQQTAGSWGTANVLGSANQFNFMGTNGNVFELFDVALYEGTTAPTYRPPFLLDELQVCKRYWQKIVPATNGTPLSGLVNGTTLALFAWTYEVEMRATPTCTGTGSGGWRCRIAGATVAVSSILFSGTNNRCTRVDATVSSGLTGGQAVLLDSVAGAAGLFANARM